MTKLTIDGLDFELVKFIPDDDHRSQTDCYLLKPLNDKPDLTKMTKAQLIEHIEALNEDN